MDKKIIRIAVIGVGNMGYAHAKHLFMGGVKDASLAALCDNDPVRLEELRKLFPDVPCYSDAEELFASGTCDAVMIATPHYAHPTIGIGAFEHGLHVISEKPLAVQVSAGEAFAKAAKSSGKAFSVMFNQRTDPVFAKAREMIKSGKLGGIKRFNWIITNWYRTQFYYDSGSWRASWRGEGGGVLMNQAPHNLDLLRWILGMPARVFSVCNVGKFHQIEVEDEALLMMEYENGATGVFHTSTGEFPGTNRLEIVGDLGKIVLEEGKLRYWKLLVNEREFCYNSKESFSKIPMEYQEMQFPRKNNAHGAILQNFVNHILYGEELISNGFEALEEVALCNGAYLSSWKGSWVDFPLDPQEFDKFLFERIKGSDFNQKRAKAENEGYQERWQVRW